ncbi:MAG: hypothetical protein OEZ68_02405 [Gammaproteobacteria bacterium]|nr:hypothetical protein [Gammaproteobacteria bacterium]MDH5799634.1 hypothetical protein [Gammaproteobacteria bacterium]
MDNFNEVIQSIKRRDRIAITTHTLSWITAVLILVNLAIFSLRGCGMSKEWDLKDATSNIDHDLSEAHSLLRQALSNKVNNLTFEIVDCINAAMTLIFNSSGELRYAVGEYLKQREAELNGGAK